MSSSASNKTPRRVTEKQWHSRLQKGINAVLQLENAFVKTPRNLAAANMVTEMDLVIKTLQSTIGIFDSYHSRPGSILHETRFEYTPVYTDDSIPQGARSIKPVRWRAQLSKALEAISPLRTVHEDTPASLAPEDLHKAVEPAFIALHQVLFRFQARRERALRTPVATLAPETLREIFLYVAEINPPHEEDLGWLILDDVCVQWHECGDLTMDLDNAMTVKLDQDEVVKKFVRRMRMEGVRVNWEGDLGNDEDEAETDPEDPEDGAEYEPEESADEDDAATESEDED
ncbi:hypothetical protein OF83DRAFT_506240 [Amylostereum chailletii]|nr:hypothetical protein OF83DRAFT_506240 [Amylostereum chailletii]